MTVTCDPTAKADRFYTLVKAIDSAGSFVLPGFVAVRHRCESGRYRQVAHDLADDR